MALQIKLDDAIAPEEVLQLYRACDWSAADKPVELMAALRNSHSLVTARVGARLVGLGNAVSDGHLVVYYPHLLVHPDYQRQGMGKKNDAGAAKPLWPFSPADAGRRWGCRGFMRARSTDALANWRIGELANCKGSCI